MKTTLILPAIVAAILLSAGSSSAQIVNTFNWKTTTSGVWNSSANWTLAAGSGSVPTTSSDKAVISMGSSGGNLNVDANGIHVGELKFASSGLNTTRLLASGSRSITIDTLTKDGAYSLVVANGIVSTVNQSLSVQIGNLNLDAGTIEIGPSSNGGLDKFQVTGTSTLAGSFLFDGVSGNNRIELGNLDISGTLTLGGRGNSTGTAAVSSIVGNGTVQVSANATHNGAAGTLLINSTNTTPSTFSGVLQNQASTQGAVLTVTKSGTGTQILSRSTGNTYSGTTTIEEGILAITNSSGSGLGTGAVSILDGGILAGSGIVDSGFGNGITAQSGGSVAPSAHLENGFTMLSLNGASNGSGTVLDMKEGSFFTLRFGADNASDWISFTNYHAGGLALFDGDIAVNGVGVQEGTFTLFAFNDITSTELGTLVGQLKAGTGFEGYNADFFWNENSILLGVTAIPEPNVACLFVLAAALLAGRGLRRKVG